MANEWMVVTKKSKKTFKLGSHCISYDATPTSVACADFGEADVQKAEQRINLAVTELKGTDFCKDFIHKFQDVLKIKHASFVKTGPDSLKCGHFDIVCYGLGSISDSYISRYQFALLVVLQDFLLDEHWEDSRHESHEKLKCSAYDPVFTKLDGLLLKRFGMELIKLNEEGRRRVDTTADKLTIFYMVHCDKFLYDNVLEANWNSSSLNRLIVIGNSFLSMKDRLLERELKSDYKFICKTLSLGLVAETPLKTWEKNDNIFNDTSIHYISARSIHAVSTSDS